MARRLVVLRQSDLDIQAAAVWYEDQRAGLGMRFLGELDEVFRRMENNPRQFQSWKAKSVERSSAIFPMECISPKARTMSLFWRCSISIGNRICGRVVTEGKDESEHCTIPRL